MKISVRAMGEKSNRPLLFLHGFLGNGRDWLPLAQSLAGDYHVLFVDLPGHGYSLAGEVGQEYTISTVAAAVADLARELSEAVLIGYSLGGRIALATAVERGYKLGGLVLESANPGIEDAEERRQRAELDDQRARQLLRLGTKRFVEQWYQQDLFRSLHAEPKRLAAMVAARSAGDAQELAVALRNLSVGRQQPLWDQLDSLKLPMLFVAGELDSRYVAIGRRIVEKAVNARLAIVADAGHNTHFEQPDGFANHLLGFLKQLGRRPG